MTLRERWDRLRIRLGDRRLAYRRTFDGVAGSAPDVVLKDLARFCRAHESTFAADPRAHAVLEGRREVFLRIAQHLNMETDQLWSLYAGRQIEDVE